MKKLLIIILILILFFVGAGVYAEGISIASDTGDNVNVLGDIRIDKKATGNVVVVFGNIDLQNDVFGNVVAIFGNVNVNAKVTGQIISILGNIRLTGKSQVYGNAVSIGTIEKQSGAKVYGQEVQILGKGMKANMEFFLMARTVAVVAFAIFTLLIGLLIIAVSGEKFKSIAAGIQHGTGKKIVIGFFGFVGATIISVLLFITLIAPVLYLVLIVLGSIFSSIYFGKVILKTFNPNSSIFAEFITGLATVTLIEIVLIYLIPQNEFLINILFYAIFVAFVNSLGIGILIDLKASRSISGANTDG